MALFSSVLTSYSTKVNGQVIDASDVNNPQTDIQQIEAILGVDGANSVVGTYAYLVKSPASDGGGHVQVANKGGTGFTSYTKGDVLIAQSASALSKLAVGLDGQVLSANSSVATGVNWISNSTAKVSASASVISSQLGTETSLMSVSISGSTLGINNAVRGTVYISNWNPNANNPSSVIVLAQYGNNTVASVVVKADLNTSIGNLGGEIKYTLIANASSVLQRGILNVQMVDMKNLNNNPSTIGVYQVGMGTSSVNTSAPQTFGITALGAGGTAFPTITTAGFLVEKIQ